MLDRAHELGYETVIGTESEFYLLDPETHKPLFTGYHIFDQAITCLAAQPDGGFAVRAADLPGLSRRCGRQRHVSFLRGRRFGAALSSNEPGG